MSLHPKENGKQMVISHLVLGDGTLDYQGQESDDLSNWQDAQSIANPNDLPTPPEGYSWLSWQVKSSSQKQFMRVEAQAKFDLIWE